MAEDAAAADAAMGVLVRVVENVPLGWIVEGDERDGFLEVISDGAAII